LIDVKSIVNVIEMGGNLHEKIIGGKTWSHIHLDGLDEPAYY
jgi:hypothetical protein